MIQIVTLRNSFTTALPSWFFQITVFFKTAADVFRLTRKHVFAGSNRKTKMKKAKKENRAF